MYTPERSQGCRAAGSAISGWSQSCPFCCFWRWKWTWLTHPRWWHTHKKNGCLSKYTHLPKNFCGAESAGTYLYQSLEQHSERQLADIVFLRPRVSLAVGRKAPAARQALHSELVRLCETNLASPNSSLRMLSSHCIQTAQSHCQDQNRSSLRTWFSTVIKR